MTTQIGNRSRQRIRLLNRPQREGLSRFEAGVLEVNKIKLTVATETGERFFFSELQGIE